MLPFGSHLLRTRQDEPASGHDPRSATFPTFSGGSVFRGVAQPHSGLRRGFRNALEVRRVRARRRSRGGRRHAGCSAPPLHRGRPHSRGGPLRLGRVAFSDARRAWTCSFRKCLGSPLCGSPSGLEVEVGAEGGDVERVAARCEVRPIQAVEHHPEGAPDVGGLGVERERFQVARRRLFVHLLVGV